MYALRYYDIEALEYVWLYRYLNVSNTTRDLTADFKAKQRKNRLKFIRHCATQSIFLYNH